MKLIFVALENHANSAVDSSPSTAVTFFGSLTLRVANKISHTSPDVPESKPQITVNVLGVMKFKDQPATPVDKLQIRNSAARSVVPIRPRSRSGTSLIRSVSWTVNSAPRSTRLTSNNKHASHRLGIKPISAYKTPCTIRLQPIKPTVRPVK